MGPIGSAVLTFIGYKQTDRQAKFIYREIKGLAKKRTDIFQRRK